MKKFLLLLLTLLACVFSIVPVSAQEDESFILTVADGTVSNDYVPIYGLYGDEFQRCQIIYPETMVADMAYGDISAMSFYFNNTPATTWTGTFDVKLGTCSESAFGDSFLAETLTTVYSGVMTISNNKLIVTFNTPYHYEGGNLLVEFSTIDKGNYKSSSFFGINMPFASIQGHNGGSLDAISAELRNFIPKTTFTYTGGAECKTPMGLTLLDEVLTATTATISWTVIDGLNYDVLYWQEGGDTITLPDVSLDGNAYTIENLLPNTTYGAIVQVFCADELMMKRSPYSISFATLPVPQTVPYFQDFETDYESISDFTLMGAGSVVWSIGAATGFPNGDVADDVHSLYVSNDNGVHNQYNINSVAYTYAVMNVEFPDDNLEYRLSFDCNVAGEANYDYLAVYVMNSTTDIIPNTVPDGEMVSTKIAMTNGWVHKDYGLGNVNGTIKKIVFYWKNDSGSGENPPAAVDNVYIYASSCSQPTDLVVTDVNSSSATLNWRETGEATSWNLYWKATDAVEYAVILVDDSTYTFTNLEPNTTYSFYVTSICGDFESGSTESVTITTPDLPVPLPFELAFEDGEEEMFPYLTLQSANINNWIIGSDVYAPEETAGSETGRSLYISNNGVTYGYSPASNYGTWWSYAYLNVEFPEEAVEWHLSFDYRVEGYEFVSYSSYYDALSVYMVDGLVDIPASGLPVGATVLLNEANHVTNWQNKDIVLNNVAGTVKKILFVWKNYSYNEEGSDPAAIDNIHIYANDCAQPTQLAADVMSESVNLTWNEVGSSESWHVYWKQNGEAEFSMLTVYEPFHLFSNLVPNTSYMFYVTAACDEGESAATDVLTVMTPATSVVLPYFEDFETNPETIADFEFSGQGANQWTIGSATGTPEEGSEETHALYVSNDNGVSNAYDNANPSESYAILNVEFPDDDLEYHIEFDYKVEGEGETTKWDYFSVYLLDPMAENPTSTTNNTGALIYRYNLSNGWQHFNTILENVNGTAKKLVFFWRNDNANGENPPVAIDNIRIEGSMCPQPTNLHITETGTDFVTVAWSQASEGSCTVEYGPAGFQHGQGTEVYGLTDGTCTIGGLAPAIRYDIYVQSDCGSAWEGPAQVILGQYIMQEGYDTLFTCSSVIYDNGGPSGNYNNSFSGTLVLYPEDPGAMMMLTGECQLETNYDSLSIFDGVGTNGTLLASYTGTVENISVISTTGPLTLRFESDGMVNLSGFELMAQCVTCLPPDDLEVSAITDSSAVLTWASTGTTDSWMVEYKSTIATEWQLLYVDGESNIELIDLEPGTSYEVKVSTICGDEVYSFPALINFATLMTTTTLPYETDFSESSDRNWLLNNGTSINRWTIGNVSDTESSLFITNNGTDAAYTWTAQSVVSAEKLFTIGTAGQVDIRFDLQIGGETFWDYLKVFFAPENADFPASTTENDFYQTTDSLYAVNFSEFAQYSHYAQMSQYPFVFSRTDTQTVRIEVMMPNPNAAPTANSTAKLVFLWVNDVSNGRNPGAIISNVSVSATSCPKPSALTVSNVTGRTAGLTWTAGAGEAAWHLEYKESNSGEWIPVEEEINTTSYTLTDLEPTTDYDVRVQAVCGEDNFSLFTMTSFTTTVACPEPTDVLVAAGVTQAVASWSGLADSYTVLCGTHIMTVEGTTATITGLTASTPYTLSIVANCGDEGSSDTVTVNFMTECEVVNTFPYTEGFENGLGCWTSNPVVNTKEWTVSEEYSTNAGSTSPVQGEYFAYYKPNAYGTVTDLVSPIFDLTTLQNPKISFYHMHKAYGSDVDTMKVYYKTSPMAEPVLLASYLDVVNYWQLDSLELLNPTAEYQIIFRGFGEWGFGIGLDGITVYNAAGEPPVLTPPTVTTESAENVTANTATLKGTITNPDNVVILAQGFQWRAVIGGTYTFVPATVTNNAMSAALTNLSPETDYRFRAFIVTAADTIYGDVMNFATLEEVVEPCATPTGLTTSSITKESITVSWDNVEGITWNVQYRTGNGPFTPVYATTNTYVVTGLTPETTYEIQVQAVCSDDNKSEWATTTATTLPDGVNSYLENSVVLYPNPAKEVVNVQCTMNNVQWKGAVIEVLDVYGKLLQTFKADSEIAQINVSNLANGMYFVRMTTDEGIVTKRFVKK